MVKYECNRIHIKDLHQFLDNIDLEVPIHAWCTKDEKKYCPRLISDPYGAFLEFLLNIMETQIVVESFEGNPMFTLKQQGGFILWK